ncbi:hypothetical protein IAT38_001609 [Cryptococcus sp. DSM 104549]
MSHVRPWMPTCVCGYVHPALLQDVHTIGISTACGLSLISLDYLHRHFPTAPIQRHNPLPIPANGDSPAMSTGYVDVSIDLITRDEQDAFRLNARLQIVKVVPTGLALGSDVLGYYGAVMDYEKGEMALAAAPGLRFMMACLPLYEAGSRRTQPAEFVS